MPRHMRLQKISEECPFSMSRLSESDTYRKEAARLEKTQKKKKVNEKKSRLSLLKIPGSCATLIIVSKN